MTSFSRQPFRFTNGTWGFREKYLPISEKEKNRHPHLGALLQLEDGYELARDPTYINISCRYRIDYKNLTYYRTAAGDSISYLRLTSSSYDVMMEHAVKFRQQHIVDEPVSPISATCNRISASFIEKAKNPLSQSLGLEPWNRVVQRAERT
jgi:hypothetical protein